MQNPIGYAAGTTTGAVLAEPLARLGARVIDIIIWIIVSSILAVVVGGGTSAVGSTDFGVRSWIAGAITTMLLIAYETYMVANKGATVGKIALGLKVVNEDGSAADLQTGFKRIAIVLLNFIPILGPLVLILASLASVVMIFTDARHQTVWDKVGKTIVVKR